MSILRMHFDVLQRDLTGVDNLEEVHFLEMKVDTRDTSLGNFGAHLPNLSQLKLSNSISTSVRSEVNLVHLSYWATVMLIFKLYLLGLVKLCQILERKYHFQ